MPIPIKTLEIGDTNRPAIIKIYKVLISISKLSDNTKEIIRIKKPPLEVTANLFIFLCCDKNTKAKENKLAHMKA